MRRLRCDVVVVGCGVAGLSAALSAAEQNASVIVLERATQEDRGGNTRWTEALLRVKETDEVWDDFEPHYIANAGYYILPEFVRASAGDYASWPSLVKALPFVDPEILEVFVGGISGGLKWLRKYGVNTHQSVYPFVPPLPLIGLYGGGLALVETLCPTIEKRGARILYEVTATKLIQDDDNRVVGLKATDANGESVIIDAKGVVLASGGFQGNPEMLVRYIGPQARYMRPVARGGWYDKGEGIQMALDIGAAPAGDYADCHRQPIDPRSSASESLVNAFPLGIVVNKSGERFFNEASSDFQYYAEQPCMMINRQTDGIGFFIYDSRINEVPNWRTTIRSDQPPIEAGSLAELAAKLGIPSEALARTVASFNAACSDDPIDASRFDGHGTRGVVPEKSNFARRISVAPFGAYPIIASATFTYGGLKVTRNAQVVSASGIPIRGLYAAGETVGIIYGVYAGSTSVLRGLVFGRLAGAHAAQSSVSQESRTSRHEQLRSESRVAIVTGGAQGIGLAVVERMLESGATVSIWDRDRSLLDATIGRLDRGERVSGEPVDIGDLAAVEAATRRVLGRHGRIDILINNAAIVGPNMPTWEYPDAAFRDVVQVGLLGTFYCCRAVVPHMIARNYGRIVNISSIAGKEGNPNAVAYSAMKAAVIALTKSLGKELASHPISVNAVTPAVAKTVGALGQSPEHLAYILAKIPRGRMLELGEAASMITWLASEDNSFTTGAVFDLSGGRATY